jgi:hypothetical protein
VHTVAPVEQAFCLLAEADPDNGLGLVLGWLCCAADEFDDGNPVEGVNGVLMADSALKRTLLDRTTEEWSVARSVVGPVRRA